MPIAGNRSIRIQIAMIALIASLTVPWLFSDIQPEDLPLSLAAEDGYWLSVSWTIAGSSGRELRIRAPLNQPLPRDAEPPYRIAMQLDLRDGTTLELLDCAFMEVPNPGRRYTRFFGMLPRSLPIAALSNATITVIVSQKEQQSMRLEGVLESHSRTVRVTHPPAPRQRDG